MKNLFLFLTFLTLSVNTIAQENQQIKPSQDSTKIEKLNEVIVRAVRVKLDAPVTHSNLTKKEISKRNLGQDIPILLNYLPSVVSSSDAGAGIGYTHIRVRGSDATRINVTINGIPYNDAESQGTFWVNLGDFSSSIQSLQLQRGVGTSTNGSGAFGASLNILTDAISKGANAEISNSFGSYGTRKHTIKFSTGKLNNHFEISGRLSNIYSDGYVDRAFADLKSYFLQASYVDDNTLIKVITFGGKEKTYQAWFGLTVEQLKKNRRQNPYTYDNETDNYEQNHYQFHWNEQLNKYWSTNIGLNYTKGEGYFEQFKENKKVADFNGIVEATDGSRTDLIVRRWLDNDFYVANFNVAYQKKALDIISGISYSNYLGDHFGEVIWAKQFADNANIRDQYYFSDAKKTDFSIFSKATFRIANNLKAFVDLQGRFVNYKTAGLTSDRNPIDINSDFSFFNPKVGFSYNINNENNLYISYARANREPNRKDFELNENVKSEKLNNVELGWRLKNKSIKLNANIYYMQYKDQLILTGDIDDTGDYRRENVANSYRLGLEFDADIRLGNKFYIRPNIAISSNKIKDFILNRDGISKNLGDTNIAFSPNIIAGNALVYQPVENLQLSFLSKYVGEQYLSNTDTEASKLDSYFTSDFNIFYELKTKSIFKSIVFTGLVNNVFNKEYVGRGYTYLDFWSTPGNSFEVQGYYPQATTNFLVGVTLKF
ncbi:MAG: TonB-dependent receptor [Flavobacteriaceae bacterium]|nr:TonB-dependent receptor [Flavobacteriaceae bacterium]